jgi:hypothetical protein
MTNLPPSLPTVWKPGSLQLLEPSGPVQGLLYILFYINETGSEVVSWIKVAYDRMQYQAPVNNAKSFEVSSKARNLLKTTTSF